MSYNKRKNCCQNVINASVSFLILTAEVSVVSSGDLRFQISNLKLKTSANVISNVINFIKGNDLEIRAI